MFIALVVLLLYSVIAHEVAHGWVAYLFGDDTARRYGRLTLNPASHIDVVATVLIVNNNINNNLGYKPDCSLIYS